MKTRAGSTANVTLRHHGWNEYLGQDETTAFAQVIRATSREAPVLIAGPTASGKSALALRIARAQGRAVVNADALQVWSCWQVLTARPSAADLAQAPHALYGHVAPGTAWSVGDWLRQVAALRGRLIVVGGTGLYLTALTRGLAQIPPTPPAIRATADARIAGGGRAAMVAELDPRTRAQIDLANPVAQTPPASGRRSGSILAPRPHREGRRPGLGRPSRGCCGCCWRRTVRCLR